MPIFVNFCCSFQPITCKTCCSVSFEESPVCETKSSRLINLPEPVSEMKNDPVMDINQRKDPLIYGMFSLAICVMAKPWPPWPKNAPKPWENKKIDPFPLSSFYLDPLHGHGSIFFCLIFRGFCHLVSTTMSVVHFLSLFWSLGAWVLGKNKYIL